jgi:hypothetical protein
LMQGKKAALTTAPQKMKSSPISPEVNWHGKILRLLAGSVRQTHGLNRRLMLRTSVNF